MDHKSIIIDSGHLENKVGALDDINL